MENKHPKMKIIIVLTLNICKCKSKEIFPNPFKPIKDLKIVTKEDKSVK